MDVFDFDSIEARYHDNLLRNRLDPALSNEDIRSLIFALRNYRKMATWMGDVLAASGGTLLDRKSTSKSERARQVSILNQVRTMLNQEYGGHERTVQRHEVVRCIVEILKDVATK